MHGETVKSLIFIYLHSHSSLKVSQFWIFGEMFAVTDIAYNFWRRVERSAADLHQNRKFLCIVRRRLPRHKRTYFVALWRGSSNKLWQEVLKLRNAYTVYGRCGVFRAFRTDVYFLLLPFKICFCGVDRDNITLLLFRLEWLKQSVPVAARSIATSRLLGLGVRIRPGAWMAVFCEYYVLSGSGLYDGRSLVQRSRTECVCVRVSLWVCVSVGVC
jgi:hypothetical protein